MSAEKSRHSPRRDYNAAAISAVVRARVRCAWGRSLGAPLQVGALPGCRVIDPSGRGTEGQGAGAR